MELKGARVAAYARYSSDRQNEASVEDHLRRQLAVLSRGAELEANAPSGGHFLLLPEAPIGDPVARRGPFVMNTDSELEQAFADYRAAHPLVIMIE